MIRRGRSAGYSLIEVLIAFTIMSLVLMALLPGQARLLERASTVEDRLLAEDFARSRLATLGIAEPLPFGAGHEASMGDWRVVESLRVLVETPNVVELRVEVYASGTLLANEAELRYEATP